MNREEIIKIARQSGVLSGYESELFQRFAALVAAAEREAVIGICEEWAKSGGDYSLLEAIHARGKE
jgi:hypothetical protein